MAICYGGVMLKAASCKLDKFFLKVVNFCNAAATKKFFFNVVISKFTFAEVNCDFAVLGFAV